MKLYLQKMKIKLVEFSDALDSVLQRTVEQKRADCDFTDRLWSVLRSKSVDNDMIK